MNKPTPANRVSKQHGQQPQGQALIEYSLILVLAFIGLIAIMLILAPAVGNVFSNTVYNLLGQTTTPQEPLNPTEFWDIVTAVASYTPESPDLETNTPPPSTPLPTNTGTAAPPTETLTPSLTYTPTDVFTPTNTFTPGPSPTPEDTDYGYPFADDGSNPDTFQDDFADEFWSNGPWTAEYWNTSNSANGCNNGNSFNSSNGNISNAPAAVITVPRIKFPEPANPDDYWRDQNDKAHPDLDNDNHCARYSISLPLEATTYTINYAKDDGVRIYVSQDGSNWTNLLDRWSYNYNEAIATNSFNYTPPSAGTYFFRVVFRDTGGPGSLIVSMNQSDENSSPTCDWEQDNSQGNTAPPSWHDSVNRSYFRDQECILRLRGTIDLTGSAEPYLEFYERYNINSFDEAIVGISIAGSNNWRDKTIHTGPSTNWTFTQQRFDLSLWADDSNTVTDFRGETIELRFIFRTDSSAEADGWWIDDVSVYEIPEPVFYLGFSDSADTGEFWIPEGDWGISNAQARGGVGSSWHDSPGFNYSNNTNTTLQLNGRLDLSASSPITVENPQVVFWQYIDIDPADRIYVEISTDKTNWTALATQSVNGSQPAGPIATGNYTALEWTQATADIPLSYVGLERVYIRFRLQADGSSTDDGWMIDDIQFRNKPLETLNNGECDTFDGGINNWVLNGRWGTTTESVRDGSFSLADSPNGSYQNNTDYTAELVLYLDIDGMTRPIVEFYHNYDMREGGRSGDEIVVEVSSDDGVTWNKVFSYYDDDQTQFGQSELDLYPNWGASIPHDNERADEINSWQREVIDLTSFIGTTTPGVPGLKYRFRLYADGSQNRDGWYIDSFCFRDSPEPLVTLPFADDMEAGTFNFYTGGKWEHTTEKARSGAYAWSDTPFGSMTYDELGIIELRPTINLTGAVDPALYYWTTHQVSNNQYLEVEIALADANGSLLSNWEQVSSSYIQNDRNDGWHRREVDLTPYVGQNIRIRWHANSFNNSGNDGMYLDDVKVISRSEEATYNGDPYFEDVEALNPGEFVFEHEWDVITENRDFGAGGSISPGQWEVNWYNGLDGSGCNPSGLRNFAGTTFEDEIDFPNNPLGGNNTYGVIAMRTFSIPATTQYTFSGQVDDGIRIWVYPEGTLYDPANPDYDLWNCGDRNFTSSPITFPAGEVVVRIEHFENTGGEQLTVRMEGQSQMFHDSPSGNYDARVDSVVELEGTIDLTGMTNPTFYWDQKYAIDNGQRILVEISTDGGFTWTDIYSQNGGISGGSQSGGGANLNWQTMSRNLTSYAGNFITYRFRLDTRGASDTNPGWWVDNIRIIE